MEMMSIVFIWGIMKTIMITIAIIIAVMAAVACVLRPRAWNNVVLEPWAKAERRAAKKKAKEELRARRAFYK